MIHVSSSCFYLKIRLKIKNVPSKYLYVKSGQMVIKHVPAAVSNCFTIIYKYTTFILTPHLFLSPSPVDQLYGFSRSHFMFWVKCAGGLADRNKFRPFVHSGSTIALAWRCIGTCRTFA